MATDAKIELVISAQDNASKVLAGVTKEMDGLTKKTSEVSASAKQAESTFSSAVSGLEMFAAAAIAAGAAMAAIGFKQAIAGIEKFEQTTMNIASQLTNMAAEGQGSFKEMFDKNQLFAKAFYEKLRNYDAERASSIEEMMTVYNSLVTQGYQVRMDEAKALSMVTDLIKQKTAGQGFEIQSMQEIRALMDGQANMHSRIAVELKERIGPAWSEILKGHEKAGTLLEYIVSLYPGIEASSERMQKTLEAQNTTLMSQLTYIGREGLAQAYEDLVAVLGRINEYLRKHADIIANDIAKGWESVRGILLGIPELIKSGVETMQKFVSELDSLSQNPIIMALLGMAGGYRVAGLAGAFAGGSTAAFWSAENIKKAAQARELKQYEVDVLEPRPTAAQLGVLGLDQTKGKVKDEFADAIKEGTVAGFKQAAAIIAKEKGLDPVIFSKLIETESRWNRYAESPKGAMGLGQLMPGTAAMLGVKDAFDAGQNLKGAATYLKQMLDKFAGRYDLALAAYNAGPGAVEKYKGIPPYRETQKYVWDVMGTGGSRASQGLKEVWKAEDDAAKEAQKSAEEAQKQREKLWQNRVRNTENYLKEELRAIDRTEQEAHKLHVKTVEYNKRVDDQYKQYSLSVNEKIFSATKLSYDERIKAAEAYKQASATAIDEEIEALRKAGIDDQVLESYRKAQIEGINERVTNALQSGAISWEAAWKRAAENVQDTLANMFDNITGKIQTGISWLDQMLNSIKRIAAEMLAQSMLGWTKNANLFGGGSLSSGGGLFGWLGGLFGGGGSGSGGLGGLFGGGSSGYAGLSADAFSALGGLSWAGAKGGILPGGFTPIHAFAQGGLVNRPTLGIIGEAGPEIVLPLDKVQGGGNYNISVAHSPTYNYRPSADDYRRDAKMIVQALDKELRAYGKRSARNFVRV